MPLQRNKEDTGEKQSASVCAKTKNPCSENKSCIQTFIIHWSTTAIFIIVSIRIDHCCQTFHRSTSGEPDPKLSSSCINVVVLDPSVPHVWLVISHECVAPPVNEWLWDWTGEYEGSSSKMIRKHGSTVWLPQSWLFCSCLYRCRGMLSLSCHHGDAEQAGNEGCWFL